MKKLMHLGMLSALIALLSFMLPVQADAQSALLGGKQSTKAVALKHSQPTGKDRQMLSIWNQFMTHGQSQQQTKSLPATKWKAPKSTVRKDPTPPLAVVVLVVEGDPWGDGTGFTLLMDGDANVYDTYMDMGGEHSFWTGGNISSSFSGDIWSNFDTFLPSETENDCNTTKFVLGEGTQVGQDGKQILAGTYDFVIGNPVPNENRYYTMFLTNVALPSAQTNIANVYHNFEFEANKEYVFHIFNSGNDAICELYVDGELYNGGQTVTPQALNLENLEGFSVWANGGQLIPDGQGIFWINPGTDVTLVPNEGKEITDVQLFTETPSGYFLYGDGEQVNFPAGATATATNTMQQMGQAGQYGIMFHDLAPNTNYSFVFKSTVEDAVFAAADQTPAQVNIMTGGLPQLVYNTPVFVDNLQDYNAITFQLESNAEGATFDGMIVFDLSQYNPESHEGAKFAIMAQEKKPFDPAESGFEIAADSHNGGFCPLNYETQEYDVIMDQDPADENIYTKTYDHVYTGNGDSYKFFFQAQNAGVRFFPAEAGEIEFGTEYPLVKEVNGDEGEGYFDVRYISFTPTSAVADGARPITITLDFSNYNKLTGEGATFKVEQGEDIYNDEEQLAEWLSPYWLRTDMVDGGENPAVYQTDAMTFQPTSTDRVYEVTVSGVAPGTYRTQFVGRTSNPNYPDNDPNEYLYYHFADGEQEAAIVPGEGYTAVFNHTGDWVEFQVPGDEGDQKEVTFRLDLSRFNYYTKNGAKFDYIVEDAAGGDPVIPEILSVSVIGETDFVYGTEAWTPSEADLMEQDAEGIYTITYENVQANFHAFKFCLNGSLSLLFGSSTAAPEYESPISEWDDATFVGGALDKSLVAHLDGEGLFSVTLKLDLRNLNYMTGEGAKYWVEYEPMPRRLVWDFAGTDFSEADKKKMDADEGSWKYTYGDDRAENKTSVGLYPLAQGRPISWTSGLEFSNIPAGKLRLDHNKSLNMNGKDLGFLIPVKAGDRLVIITANAGNNSKRGLSADNLTVESGFELVKGTEDVTNSGIVEEDGYVNIVTVGGGINIKKIEIIPADQQSKSFVFLKPSDWYSYTMVYAWDSNGEPLLGPWPGSQLNYSEDFLGDGDAGEYWRINVPAGAVGIVLSDDPNGQMNQTVDITDFTHDYQTTGSKDDLNHWEVTTFNYVANGD